MSNASSPRSSPDMSVVILCGGLSQRFGFDKGLAPFRGKVMVERLLGRLAILSDDIFLSTNQPEHYGFLGYPLVADIHPGCGPLGGLEASLQHARHALLAAVACDMPFASPQLLRFLANHADVYDAVVPQRLRKHKPRGGARASRSALSAEVSFDGDKPKTRPCTDLILKPEPLHAVYARSALEHVVRAIELDHLKPALLLCEMNSLLIAPEVWSQVESKETRCFTNVNTPEALEQLGWTEDS